MISFALLLAWLPLALALVGTLVGALVNWWFGLTDWQTFAIAAAASMLLVWIVNSGSPWMRLAVIGTLVVAAYLKGHVDGVQVERVKIERLRSFEAERQRRANEEAQAEARQREAEYHRTIVDLREQIDSATNEATSDVLSKRPALGLDAVRRLNRVRTK